MYLSISAAAPSVWISFVAIGVVVVIIGAVVVFIVLSYAFVKRRTSLVSSDVSKKRKPPPLHECSTMDVIVSSEGRASSQGLELLSSHGESSHVSTPTSIESSAPLLYDSSSKYTALIIYSPNTPEEKQDFIRSNFIPKLESDGIRTLSHDFACIKESPSSWLEREIAKATVVLCVCNKEFKEDWEGRNPNTASSLPLVQSLRHLILATVHQGGDLSKYAVVLLESCDQKYIPTMYLRSDPRQFRLTEVDAVARFVCNVPSHRLDNERLSLGYDRKQYVCTCV